MVLRSHVTHAYIVCICPSSSLKRNRRKGNTKKKKKRNYANNVKMQVYYIIFHLSVHGFFFFASQYHQNIKHIFSLNVFFFFKQKISDRALPFIAVMEITNFLYFFFCSVLLHCLFISHFCSCLLFTIFFFSFSFA